MESNFASWKAGCEIRSIPHMPPGHGLHPCHINFQVIINTFIRTLECVYLSTFTNAIFVERAAGWYFDEASRLGSRPGCRLFCGFPAYWFPPTVLTHETQSTVASPVSETPPSPIEHELWCSPKCRHVRMLSEDRCNLYSVLNRCSLSKEYIILCTQESRHDASYWLIITLNILLRS